MLHTNAALCMELQANAMQTALFDFWMKRDPFPTTSSNFYTCSKIHSFSLHFGLKHNASLLVSLSTRFPSLVLKGV